MEIFPKKIKPYGMDKKYQEVVKSLMRIYRQGKTQRRVVKMYLDTLSKVNSEEVSKQRATKLAERIEQLSLNDKLSLDGFWKLKKSYTNKGSVLSSVVNDQGVEVLGTDAIINEFRNEFVTRLTPAKMDVEMEKFEEMTVRLTKLCVELGGLEKTPDFSSEELDVAISQLKKGKAFPDSYPAEVFIHGGKELREFVLLVVNKVKNNQLIPSKWARFKIVTIYKNKGSLKKLVNQRGIFLTPVISKIFEKLIKERIDEKLQRVSKWQAGSRRNRGPQDQTFLTRSAINHSLYVNKPLFLTLYDFRQCFDKIWLEDSLLSIWKLGVRDDMLTLISALNESSVGTVKTAGGETECFELGPNAKQGTVLGPILSSASIAECCDEQMIGGAVIGNFVAKALGFVDDLLGLNGAIRDVHISHDVVTFFSKKKRIPLNEEKCLCLPINVSDKEATPVLVVNGKEIDICEIARYLGDIFNSKGNNSDLVDDRVKKGLACMMSSVALASEISLGVHLIKILVCLYKIMFLTVVLFNSGAWSNLTSTDIKRLTTIQLKFLKRILHAPSSATNSFVFLELGIIPIEYNIHMSQLNFLHHILTLEEDDPVYLAYCQQKLFEFEKNWYNEVETLRTKYGINKSNEQIKRITREKWKAIVKEHINKYALEQLNVENSQKSRTSHFSDRKTLEIQNYFLYLPPADARLYFAIRCGIVDLKTVRKYKYGEEDVMCRLCEIDEETLGHVINGCAKVPRTCLISDIYSLSKDVVVDVVARMKTFVQLVEEQDSSDTED